MVVNLKVPEELKDKRLLDAIGMGLFDLAQGVRPDPELIPEGNVVSVEFTLSAKAASFWELLLPKFNNNKRRLAREALCLVYHEPEHCLQCRI